MYRKATTMNDDSTAEKILSAATPTEARALGRQVRDFDGQKWKAVVEGVAEDAQWLKFSQVQECREALLGTADLTLVEASPVDAIWGIGYRGDEAEGREDEWGKNILGVALMKVRDRLRKEQKGEDGKAKV